MKKIYIDTLGCAKNEYDSQMLAASLAERGCLFTDDPQDADILIVNTCGFIEDAKKESIERIFELADERGEDKKLVVTGCLSERYHDELAAEMPEVDMFFGVNDYDDLPGILLGDDPDASRTDASDAEDNIGNEADGKASDAFADRSGYISDRVGNGLDDLRYRKRLFDEGSYYGYLKIAEGCNNACSFCAIPLIRGPFRSKRMEDCIAEARDMAEAGIKELILIAQDTSQYGRDLYGEVRLPELLRELCRIDGIEWIRLMYVYDNGITDKLIDVIASEPKVCKYIDMPIQHISDHVLDLMRRQSSGDSIKAVIQRLRDRIPDVHIRTTLLVGFPGETEEDIDKLIGFIDSFDIDRLGAFAFSDEEGTPSYDMDGKVPEDIREARRDRVMEHQLAVSERLNEKKIGRVYEVIVDAEIPSGDPDADGNADADATAEHESAAVSRLYEGRTRYDAPEIDCAVTFSSEEELEPGDIVKVRITDAYEYDLEGVHHL